MFGIFWTSKVAASNPDDWFVFVGENASNQEAKCINESKT